VGMLGRTNCTRANATTPATGSLPSIFINRPLRIPKMYCSPTSLSIYSRVASPNQLLKLKFYDNFPKGSRSNEVMRNPDILDLQVLLVQQRT